MWFWFTQFYLGTGLSQCAANHDNTRLNSILFWSPLASIKHGTEYLNSLMTLFDLQASLMFVFCHGFICTSFRYTSTMLTCYVGVYDKHSKETGPNISDIDNMIRVIWHLSIDKLWDDLHNAVNNNFDILQDVPLKYINTLINQCNQSHIQEDALHWSTTTNIVQFYYIMRHLTGTLWPHHHMDKAQRLLLTWVTCFLQHLVTCRCIVRTFYRRYILIVR